MIRFLQKLTIVSILLGAGGACAQQPPATPAAPAPAATQAPAAQPARNTSQSSKTSFPVTGAPATLENVVLSAIKYGALDMTTDQAIDDFAQLEYCDIYKKYRGNEFDWRKVRIAMREKIKLDKANYPDTLYLERPETFGQYDFASGTLALARDSEIHTRALLVSTTSSPSYCGAGLSFMPHSFIAVLDKPLAMDGVELSEEEARNVISRLAVSSKNDPGRTDQRTAYGRYTITFTGTEASASRDAVRLTARLDDITLYEDPDFAHPFWNGQSSVRAHRQEQGELDTIPFKGIDTLQETPADVNKPIPMPTTPTVSPQK